MLPAAAGRLNPKLHLSGMPRCRARTRRIKTSADRFGFPTYGGDAGVKISMKAAEAKAKAAIRAAQNLPRRQITGQSEMMVVDDWLSCSAGQAGIRLFARSSESTAELRSPAASADFACSRREL
jgi:hypothetical protein